MKRSALAALLALTFATVAHAEGDPKATIADLDARLVKIGAPKIEGTAQAGEKTVPALFFGERKINGNYDVVDAVRKASNATATVFVKDGNEFVRVSTNVLTPEGKRGVGTTLAHNAAYEAVSKGSQFCGAIDVLGTPYDACYNPIKDASGKLVAVSYVGHKK
jgi:Cache 3/Cache 2 fusion domain